MRVALVHEWLVTWAGSERVLAELAGMYPEAPIYTLLHEPGATRSTALEGREIRTSPLQRLPAAVRQRHRALLPLMPRAVESLDLRGFDVVITSNHAVAKGVLTRADQLHLCYCHTPMRYAWDLYHDHLDGVRGWGGVKRVAAAGLLHRLRLWDAAAAGRVDVFVANSRTVQRRIAKHYRRRAEVVYPPVDVARFAVDADEPREDWYLAAGRLVDYKRTDVAVRAFAGWDRRLVVAGDGPARRALERLAGRGGGPNVTMVGRVDDAELRGLLRRCRALVFAADEDFGIVPVEAMAAGAPVIALRRGGAAETVVEGAEGVEGGTGVLFDEQTPESLRDAVLRFEAKRETFDSARIARHAGRFGAEGFREKMRTIIDGAWADFREHGPPIDDE